MKDAEKTRLLEQHKGEVNVIYYYDESSDGTLNMASVYSHVDPKLSRDKWIPNVIKDCLDLGFTGYAIYRLKSDMTLNVIVSYQPVKDHIIINPKGN